MPYFSTNHQFRHSLLTCSTPPITEHIHKAFFTRTILYIAPPRPVPPFLNANVFPYFSILSPLVFFLSTKVPPLLLLLLQLFFFLYRPSLINVKWLTCFLHVNHMFLSTASVIIAKEWFLYFCGFLIRVIITIGCLQLLTSNYAPIWAYSYYPIICLFISNHFY